MALPPLMPPPPAVATPADARRQKALLARRAELQGIQAARLESRKTRLERERAVRHLKHFARRFWAALVPSAPRPVWSAHMDVICDEIQWALEERRRRLELAVFIEDAYPLPDQTPQRLAAKAEMLGSLPRIRVLINVPPGHSKTTLLTMAAAWWHLHRPAERFLVLSAVETLVEASGESHRDLYRDPEYQTLQKMAGCAGVTISTSRAGKKNWANTAGGLRESHTFNGAFTGANGDVIICDDPHDLEALLNKSSESVRREMDKAWTTYQSKIQDRRRDAVASVEILVMQRLDTHDLSGRWIAELAPRVVALPSEYQPDHPWRYGDPAVSGGLYAHDAEHPAHSAGDWRTEAGELLNPERFDATEIAQQRKDPLYAAKGLQNPRARGKGGFRIEWLMAPHVEPYTTPPAVLAHTMAYYISVDTNKKKSGKSATAILVCGVKGTLLYPLYRVLGQWDWAELLAGLDGVLDAWPDYKECLIEDTAHGTTYLSHRRGQRPRLVPWSPTKDAGSSKSKEDRATFAEAAALAGEIIPPDELVAPWVTSWRQAIASFPDQDDDMDALSQLIIHLNKKRQRRGGGGGSTSKKVGAAVGILTGRGRGGRGRGGRGRRGFSSLSAPRPRLRAGPAPPLPDRVSPSSSFTSRGSYALRPSPSSPRPVHRRRALRSPHRRPRRARPARSAHPAARPAAGALHARHAAPSRC